MKFVLASILMLFAVSAQAEYVCKLSKPGAKIDPDTVYVDDSKLQEFIETMESQGVTVKCVRSHDA